MCVCVCLWCESERAFYSIRLCNINVLLMVGGSEEAFPAAGRTVNNSSGSRGADSGHGDAGCGPLREKETWGGGKAAICLTRLTQWRFDY